jgi:predicted alpha/beta superfamily hydrolase
MLSFGIGATFTLFIINYTATIINVLFAFTPSQFTSNSLIVVNQEEEKKNLTNH